MNRTLKREFSDLTNSLPVTKGKKKKCSCEFGNIKSLGKGSRRYTMCDFCSEMLFTMASSRSDSHSDSRSISDDH